MHETCLSASAPALDISSLGQRVHTDPTLDAITICQDHLQKKEVAVNTEPISWFTTKNAITRALLLDSHASPHTTGGHH
ncbi:hypothetical protein AALO_G00014960 [Alosa alosa]|uniref:Uncharacterized protein n=1 Tax=Alosa alosa TaxID=278164 RepID=A0AAV6HM15_9TELE|nr:hypothetical protein AALO_G00014960 [Alosa alosa]